mgnify:CR=1 FL=1
MAKSILVTNHINNLQTLFAQHTSLDQTIKENERADILLQSLPNLYDELNIANGNVIESLCFEDVAGTVLEGESQRKNKEERLAQQEEALTL